MADLGELAAKLILDNSQYNEALQNSNAVSESFGSKLSGTFGKIAGIVGGVSAAVVGVGTAIVALGSEGGTIMGLQQAFQSNFNTLDGGIKKIQDAAKGTVDDFDIMKQANYAASLGITNNVDDIAGLMQTARFQARAMGISTTDAFEQLTEGIGKGSDRILKALGLQVPDSLQKTMSKMDETQKKQVLLNWAVQQGSAAAAKYGVDSMTSAEKVEAMKMKFDDLKDTIMIGLAPAAGAIADGIGEIITKLMEWWGTFKSFYDTALKPIFEALGEYLKNIIQPAWDSLRIAVQKFIDYLTPYWPIIQKALEYIGILIGSVLIGAIVGVVAIITAAITIVSKLLDFFRILGETGVSIFDGIKNSIRDVIDWVQKLIDKIKGIGSGIGAGASGALKSVGDFFGNLFGAKASGGLASGWTIVGENGPELVDLPNGANIVNNPQSKELLSQNNNKNVNMYNTFNINKSEDISVYMRELNWLYRRT